MYNNKKIFIWGAARSGIAASLVLAKDNNVVLTDLKELNSDVKDELTSLGIEIIITDDQINLLDNTYDLIIKNPGIMPHHPLLKKAKELGIKVENEMEVAYNYLPKETFIIGITGSNGKTTTSTIVYELLKKMNKRVVFGGNIGIPLCDMLKNIDKDTILLLEISDHQLLQFDKFKTNISLLTNIYEAHIDYHGTFEKYKNTKKMIFNNHSDKDINIFNKSSKDSMDLNTNISGITKYFKDENNYLGEDGIYINKELIVKYSDIFLEGNHNYENILAALMIINEFGIDKDIVKDFLRDFKGVEHRIEFVREINNVKYYNDSKSTNTTSLITALKTFDKPVNLILGGVERTQDFNDANDYMQNVKCIYSIGETTDRVYDYANSINIDCIKCYTLKNAVDEIQKNILSDEIVLLSPASASQDQYEKFEDRGKEFKDIVDKL